MRCAEIHVTATSPSCVCASQGPSWISEASIVLTLCIGFSYVHTPRVMVTAPQESSSNSITASLSHQYSWALEPLLSKINAAGQFLPIDWTQTNKVWKSPVLILFVVVVLFFVLSSVWSFCTGPGFLSALDRAQRSGILSLGVEVALSSPWLTGPWKLKARGVSHQLSLSSLTLEGS